MNVAIRRVSSGHWLVLLLCAALALCAGGDPMSAVPKPTLISKLDLTSSAFAPGAKIPPHHTCSAADVSPPLSWSEPPAGTQSFALIMDDPDAPGGTWTHWVIFDLPAQTRSLDENVEKIKELPNGARQGRNDFGKFGYGGPCPPPGKPHRYFFKLYALDRKLALIPGATKENVEKAMQGHILAEGELMGRFGR